MTPRRGNMSEGVSNMKTYQFSMPGGRWRSIIIVVLCIAMLVMLCTPYFTYGDVASNYASADGDDKILYGKTWVISGAEEGTDGYQKIAISADGKNSTLYTTNILRVNQNKAIAAFDAALANYNEIAGYVEKCDALKQQCKAEYDALVASTNAFADELKADMAANPAAVVEVVADAAYTETALSTDFNTVRKTVKDKLIAELTPAEAAADERQVDIDAANKQVSSAEKKLADAEKAFNTASTQLANAKAALDDAAKAVELAFSADATLAWADEDVNKYYDALIDAYPEEFKDAYANFVALDGFKALLGEKFPEESKAIQDSGEKKFADKLYSAKMGQMTKADLDKVNDKINKALRTAKIEEYKAENADELEKLTAEANEYAESQRDALTKKKAPDIDKEKESFKTTKSKDMIKALTAEIEATLRDELDKLDVSGKSEAQALAAKRAYVNEAIDKALTEKQAEFDANLAAAVDAEYTEEVYNAKVKELVDAEVAKAAAKKLDELLGKKVDSKYGKSYYMYVEALSDKEKAELYNEYAVDASTLGAEDRAVAGAAMKDILAGKMSGEARDEAVFGKLAEFKATSADAAKLANAAQKATEKAIKDGAEKNTVKKGNDDLAAIQKAQAAVDEIIAKYAPAPEEPAEGAEEAETEAEAPVEEAKPVYTAAEVARYARTDYINAELQAAIDADSKEPEVMETPCTVKYNKGTVTFTFANGKEKKSDFAVLTGYDGETELSLLGYVGFPYNHTGFSDEMAYKIKGFYINDVVLLPIVLMVLGIAGIVKGILSIFSSKKRFWGVGVCPAAAGLVGFIGYLASDFLKLGTPFTFHVVFYIVMLLFAALHIYLDFKAAKKAAK